MYDAGRPAHHAVYRTAAWRKLSAQVRAAADRCHWCGKRTAKLVADHIIPVEQRPDLALDPSNVVAADYGCNTGRGRNLRSPSYRQVGMYEVMANPTRQTTPGGRRPDVSHTSAPDRSEGLSRSLRVLHEGPADGS